MTRLAALLPEATCPAGLGVVEICGLTADSREVEPGFVFFAVSGTREDGLGFVSQAIEKGAVAIVAERQPPDPVPGIAFVLVDDARRALSKAAAIFFAQQPETIVAITGTSGKTSVAAFCRQIWQRLGHEAASLGTIGVVTSNCSDYGSLTTPDPVGLHRRLAELAGGGVTHLALEASSHGIEQKRLDGVRLKAGAFTNLSRDHLDYHKTVEAYLSAKLRLFDTLLPRGVSAVVNTDSDVAPIVIEACTHNALRVVDVGRRARRLRLVESRTEGLVTELKLDFDGQPFSVRLPLAGDFQVSNALVAAGLCIATGSAPEPVVNAMSELEGAPGRLQLVGHARFPGQTAEISADARVFIDYAHKPDALEKILGTLRPLTARQLTIVFGCGGNRDRGKRPVMGEIAARLADRIIVTDDNPRTEPPETVRQAILAGAKGGKAEIYEIGDRAAAINAAVACLKPGDVLVIAGKGHETGQIVGTNVLPFSDLDVARRALQNLRQDPAAGTASTGLPSTSRSP